MKILKGLVINEQTTESFNHIGVTNVDTQMLPYFANANNGINTWT